MVAQTQKLKNMKALIEYTQNSYGCQKWESDELVDTFSPTNKSIEIEFEKSEKLTAKVAALKKFYDEHLPFQYGNSVTFVNNVKVTLLS